MDASNSDSSFSIGDESWETHSDLENLYDSDMDSTEEAIGPEQAVCGWLYEPMRRQNDQEERDERADEATGTSQTQQSRIGNTNW